MSGQQIGTVVGGIIGSFFPVIGTQLGMVIGGMIGGAIDPEVIKAPGIGDAQSQTTAAGVPRPVVFGHPPPFMGNIIDGEHKARKITVEEGGKGGPVVEQERFLLTSAIRICAGPIAGVARIWRNGDVVADFRADGDFPEYADATSAERSKYIAEIRAKTVEFMKHTRIYLGDEDQLPDPALEAIHGVGNTPYYRGTCYMVREDDDVTDTRGACAQYQFEVMAAATLAETVIEAPSASRVETPYWSGFGTGRSNYVDSVELSSDMALKFRLSNFHVSNMAARIRMAPVWTPWATAPSGVATQDEYNYVAANAIYDSGWWAQSEADAEQFRQFEIAAGRTPPTIRIGLPSETVLSTDRSPWGFITMADMYHVNYGDAAMNVEWPNVAGVAGTVTPDSPGLIIGSDGNLYVPEWETASLEVLTATSVTLGGVISSIADRCGVPSTAIDATALPDIIPGFLIAVQSTGADCIRPCQQMYFFDMPEFDGQIVAVKRGGTSIATITDDDMLEADDKDDDTRAQAVEFPLKVSVVTRDPAADYSPMPQTSTRYSSTVKALGETQVASPIPFGADEAKQRADIIHKVLWAQAEGRSKFELPEEWTRLVPSDCYDRNGKRWMIESVDYADGAVKVNAVYDRASNYVSDATGIAAPPPTLPSSGLRGPTILAAMNLPPLREQDSVAGVYLAATGTMPGWDGCTVQMSVDGGATYRTVATITRRTTLGNITTEIGPTTEPIPITLHDGQLYDSTSSELDLGANAFALVSRVGVSEVGQFIDAAEVDPEDYEISSVRRGVLGTDATSHANGTQFVMIGSTLFLPVDSSLYGSILYFRGVTNGTDPDAASVVSLVFTPPPPPADYRITESGDYRITEAGDRRILE